MSLLLLNFKREHQAHLKRKMSINLKWDITYKCNLMCGHCINGNYLNQNENELSFDEVKKIVDLIHEKVGVERIQFLGGEPLTRKDFIDILEYLDAKGIAFGFNTNGLLINSASIERLGRLQNFDSVTLSLEGPTEEINDAIRGKRVYNILLDRMKQLIQYKQKNPSANFHVSVNMVVTSQNYNYIAEMIELCRKENISELNLLEFIEEGNGVGKHLSLSREQLLDAIKTVAEQYTKHRGEQLKIIPKFVRPMAIDYARHCLNLNFPEIIHGCGAGSTLAFLDNCGRIYSCDRYRNYKGVETGKWVLQEDFWDIFDSKEFTEPFSIYYGDEMYKEMTPCNNCKYLYESCMPCYLCKKEPEKEMKLCKLFQQYIEEKERCQDE